MRHAASGEVTMRRACTKSARVASGASGARSTHAKGRATLAATRACGGGVVDDVVGAQLEEKKACSSGPEM